MGDMLDIAEVSITKNGAFYHFILKGMSWNDFDNDMYILYCQFGNENLTVKVADIKEANSLIKKLIGGSSTDRYFRVDTDGEIQGDIYGKVVKENEDNVIS